MPDKHPPARDREPPILVEATRGKLVESRHRGSAVVANAAGNLLAVWGSVESSVFPRSAVKPLQAIALFESGAADRFALTDAEIALACASHSGEPQHVETVAAWLARMGLSERDLECGVHPPAAETAANALARAGASPGALHNNCSGKHTGMLASALALGLPLKGYIQREHPLQARILAILAGMTGAELAKAPWGIDGCGIPTVAIPLAHLALGMARLGAPKGESEVRQRACERIRNAMTAHPFLVAGTGRFCTRLMQATGDAVVLKTGAEGVMCASIPSQQLGIAIKIEDGAARAAEVSMANLLLALDVLAPDAADAVREMTRVKLYNRAGLEVGELRPATGWVGM
jgi:L-asparaginase II